MNFPETPFFRSLLENYDLTSVSCETCGHYDTDGVTINIKNYVGDKDYILSALTIIGRFWALLNGNSSTLATSLRPHPSIGAIRNPTEDELEDKLGLQAYREWTAVEKELRLDSRVDNLS